VGAAEEEKNIAGAISFFCLVMGWVAIRRGQGALAMAANAGYVS
jgi:hypothetical protein